MTTITIEIEGFLIEMSSTVMFLNASQFQMRWLALSIGHLTSVFSVLSFELNVDSFDFAFLLKSGFLTTLDFGDSNFEVDGVQLSKQSCVFGILLAANYRTQLNWEFAYFLAVTRCARTIGALYPTVIC